MRLMHLSAPERYQGRGAASLDLSNVAANRNLPGHAAMMQQLVWGRQLAPQLNGLFFDHVEPGGTQVHVNVQPES